MLGKRWFILSGHENEDQKQLLRNLMDSRDGCRDPAAFDLRSRVSDQFSVSVSSESTMRCFSAQTLSSKNLLPIRNVSMSNAL